MKNETVKALGLFSGGLDSILACLLLRAQGIEVTGICFETPFFTADKAQQAAEENNIPLIVKDIFDVYMPMLLDPNVGYGRNMNPCMDCHSLMFKLAGDVMEQDGFDFLFSGEVLGQRPMSQSGGALRYVAKHSGRRDKILRPLSALRLDETEMERQGLVNRSLLGDLQGRSRKPQMALAQQFGVLNPPQSGGGCLLTDVIFSNRLRDLIAHEPDLGKANVNLLNHGRHFRLSATAKLIVGRDQRDNQGLMRYFDATKHVHLKTPDYPGPESLLVGTPDAASLTLAASIAVGYSRAPRNQLANVCITEKGQPRIVVVMPLDPAEVKSKLI